REGTPPLVRSRMIWPVVLSFRVLNRSGQISRRDATDPSSLVSSSISEAATTSRSRCMPAREICSRATAPLDLDELREQTIRREAVVETIGAGPADDGQEAVGLQHHRTVGMKRDDCVPGGVTE